MKKLLVFLCSVILVAAMGGAAGAATVLIDDNFDGGLGDWTLTNSVQIAQAGTFANLQGMTDNFALLGLGTTSNFHGLSRTVFAPPTTTTLTVSFDWAFDFFDGSLSANDAFVSVITDNRGVTRSLVDINSGTGAAAVFGFFFQEFNLPELAANGGDITIAFGLFEDPAVFTNSIAGVDDVFINAEAVVAPVPIPTTLLLFGSGLIGMVGLRRRKKA